MDENYGRGKGGREDSEVYIKADGFSVVTEGCLCGWRAQLVKCSVYHV